MKNDIKKILELDLAIATHDRVNEYAHANLLPHIGIETIHMKIVEANMTIDQLADECNVVAGLTYEVEEAYEELSIVDA